MRRDEDGSMVIWLCGSLIVFFLLTGICVDVWRAVAAQRALATAVDAAAAAGGNMIDEAAWRDRDELRLDPPAAENVAADNLASQPNAAALSGVTIAADPDRIVVGADNVVDLTLLRLFGQPSVTVSAESSASPRRTS